MRKLTFLLLGLYLIIRGGQYSFAQGGQTLEIIPTANQSDLTTIQSGIIYGTGGHVRERYNNTASGLELKDQIVSGVMTWNTLIDYGVELLKFLSQVGIAIGALMFIYVGYQYIMSVIGGIAPQPTLLRNAIIGILIIIFSYAIIRLLTRTFLR